MEAHESVLHDQEKYGKRKAGSTNSWKYGYAAVGSMRQIKLEAQVSVLHDQGKYRKQKAGSTDILPFFGIVENKFCRNKFSFH